MRRLPNSCLVFFWVKCGTAASCLFFSLLQLYVDVTGMQVQPVLAKVEPFHLKLDYPSSSNGQSPSPPVPVHELMLRVHFAKLF